MAETPTIRYKNGSEWIDILHPVNSFYFSADATSPSELFGGTWIQITNAAIRGATSTGYTGSDTCTLTISQMPSHNHNVNGLYPVTNGASQTFHTTYWGQHTPNSGLVNTQSTGGGKPIPLCSALSTAISGTGLRKPPIRGGVR